LPDGRVRRSLLQPIIVSSSTPVISISTNSLVEIPPRWRIAGWVEIYSKFLNLNHRLEDEQPIRINRGNFYNFSHYDLPIPFPLEIRFPWWLPLIQLTVRGYIDESGRYLDPAVEDIIEELQGRDYNLEDVNYSRNAEDPRLIDSIFTVRLSMERYRIGRFRDIESGRYISDPIVRMQPYLLICIFTSEKGIMRNTISVNIGL
jgi:hypothetical protein